jgi:ubiquinone/menaquinone biosynthesis C-methylase UbiE
MKGNYDTVASFYDWLSTLIFGEAILQAHKFLIDAVPAGSQVLIAGGGTGFILEEISKKHIGGLQITYVDISEKMIALSKKRNIGGNKVLFINKAINDTVFNQQFDVVITPFFLDNFSNSTAKIIFDKMDAVIAPDGLWLFADFQSKKNKLWQKLLLKIMYLFFRIVCNIEASHLPDFPFFFNQHNYQAIDMKTFYKDFIYAVIYQKQEVL